ncbi:MAG TPA: bifunctional DNA primase/polymerase [Steroidobacteraceae bacterium]|jgi:hypothetical protein
MTTPNNLTAQSGTAPATSNNTDAAVKLAELGWHVFWLPPELKAPRKGEPGLPEWQKRATSDLTRVRQWWTENPARNIAIATGNGVGVFDLDPKSGGPASLIALEAEHGPLPSTLTAQTPSGGAHYFFTVPRELRNSVSKIAPGLDIRGDGGYVCAAPSWTREIPGKQSEGYYRWCNLASVAPMPEWLLALAEAETPKVCAAPTSDLSGSKLRSATPEQWADIRSALAHLATVSDVARNDLWSEIGYALKPLGDEARELWCEWSARAPGYGGVETPEGWWDSHKEGRSDFRRLFTVAKTHGWVNPHPAGESPDPAVVFASQGIVPAGMSPMPVVARSRFIPVDAWTFADGPDPSWRVAGLLPEQGLAMIFGASGSGKSFFALDLVMAISRGVPYGHDRRAVVQGKVVYVIAEGAGGFRRRLRAYRTRHQLPAGSPAPLLVPAAPNLMAASDVSDLQAGITAVGGADVVVVDTLHASVAGADENSAKDMGVLLGYCRALQAATHGLVILIHHSGKDEERGARGSSAIKAAMDAEIEVTAAADYRMAQVTKMRDGDTNAAAFFNLADVALSGDRPGTGAVVEHIPRPEKAKSRRGRTSAEQSLAVDQLQLMISSGAYPEGVPLEVLVAGIRHVRPDMRTDNIQRSISKAITAGRMGYGIEQKLRVSPP